MTRDIEKLRDWAREWLEKPGGNPQILARELLAALAVVEACEDLADTCGEHARNAHARWLSGEDAQR